jgi:hypothetical protein
MNSRKILATAILASQLLVTLGFGVMPASAASGFTAKAQARGVVSRFFQTINARQFAKTCDLMSTRFYRANHIPDKKHCLLGLSVGFANSPTVFFRILRVRPAGEEMVVKVVANGVRGEIVLVRESGHLKVLRLNGS